MYRSRSGSCRFLPKDSKPRSKCVVQQKERRATTTTTNRFNYFVVIEESDL